MPLCSQNLIVPFYNLSSSIYKNFIGNLCNLYVTFPIIFLVMCLFLYKFWFYFAHSFVIFIFRLWILSIEVFTFYRFAFLLNFFMSLYWSFLWTSKIVSVDTSYFSWRGIEYLTFLYKIFVINFKNRLKEFHSNSSWSNFHVNLKQL